MLNLQREWKKDLDQIEEGKNKGKKVLEDFYVEFEKFLERASKEIKMES